MSSHNQNELISLLSEEKSTLERVSSDLLKRLEKKEESVVSLSPFIYFQIKVKAELAIVKAEAKEKDISIGKA